ncbi:hypothetical protein R1flu_017564 [Riccia fluitans]|uniref:Strictosidine synthase conserved region domain-containing protein n=1 Tax=Riccia fluitans TaxID=41844 RepID=A0ABD1ZEM8_9MARC
MAPSLPTTVALVLAVMVIAFASFVQKYSPLDPVSIDFGSRSTVGFWKPEFNLQNLEKIFVGEGPEDVVFDKQGRAYTGCADGWVKRIELDGRVTNFSFTGGRPLGLEIRNDLEVMYLADSKLGLYEISLSDGTPHFIANKDDEEGIPMGLADAVAITSDGIVYLTDATTKFTMDNSVLDILEGRPNGRLLKYDPVKKSLTVVKKNMYFANGVALSSKEDFLLICETSRSRVMRLWLKGEKEGSLEMFLTGFPGFPDNVKHHEGKFYIGLVSSRTAFTDWIFSSSIGTQLRRIIPYVPSQIYDPMALSRQVGRLIVVSEEGQLLRKYEDPTGKVINIVTGGNRFGDYLYVNSLIAPYIGRIKVGVIRSDICYLNSTFCTQFLSPSGAIESWDSKA